MRITNLGAALAAPLAGLAITAAAAPAQAAMIVNTGDPGNTSFGYTLLGPGAIPGFPSQSIAARFNVAATDTITGIEGWVNRLGSGGGSYHIALYKDGPGPNHWVPGAEIYATPVLNSGPGNGYIGVDGLDWLVGPGDYWLAFEVRAGDSLFGFMPYFVANPLREAIGPPGAFRPAPGAPGSAFHVYATDAREVPEPGVWALLLLGFGAVGAALRARHAPRAAFAAGVRRSRVR